MVYNPILLPVRSWTELGAYYANLNQHGFKLEKMSDLIHHVISLSVVNRIVASTVILTDLIISIYNPIERNRETLYISFDRDKQEWEFIYYALPDRRPEFVRRYPAELGIEKFDQFITWINW